MAPAKCKYLFLIMILMFSTVNCCTIRFSLHLSVLSFDAVQGFKPEILYSSGTVVGICANFLVENGKQIEICPFRSNFSILNAKYSRFRKGI